MSPCYFPKTTDTGFFPGLIGAVAEPPISPRTPTACVSPDSPTPGGEAIPGVIATPLHSRTLKACEEIPVEQQDLSFRTQRGLKLKA